MDYTIKNHKICESHLNFHGFFSCADHGSYGEKQPLVELQPVASTPEVVPCARSFVPPWEVTIFSKNIYTWTIFHSYKRIYDTNLYLLVLGIMEKIVPSLEDLALLPRWKHGEGASYWPWVKRLTIDAYGVRLPMVNICTDNWSNWTGIEPGDGGRGQCSPTGCT